MPRTVLQDLTIAAQNSEAFSVRWNNDDSHLAAGMGDGSVRVYSSADGSFIRRLNCRVSPEALPVTAVRWRPGAPSAKGKDVLLVTTASGAIMHWQPLTGKEVHRAVLPENQCLAADYGLDGTCFAVGCQDMTIRIYDENTQKVSSELLPSAGDRVGHSNRIFSIKWIDNFTLASGGWDNSVLIWDIRERQVARSLFGPHICGDALDVRGTVLVSAAFTMADQLELWDFSAGRKLQTHTLHFSERPCMAYTVQFSKVDAGFTMAVGGSGGDECHFFESDEMHRFSVVPSLPRAVYTLDHAHSDTRVALGCGDGSIQIVHSGKTS